MCKACSKATDGAVTDLGENLPKQRCKNVLVKKFGVIFKNATFVLKSKKNKFILSTQVDTINP